MAGTDMTDGRGTGQTMASIVAASLAGLLVSGVAQAFLVGVSWSAIHGGMPMVPLIVLWVLGMVLPPVLGGLAAWATYRSWPQPQPQQRATKADSIRLTCPLCGCSMKPTAEYSTTPDYTVVKCPIHGPFHFGPGLDLTLGTPPLV